VRLAWLLIGSRPVAAAEDVAQDAMAAVYRAFERIDSPSAYLRRGGRQHHSIRYWGGCGPRPRSPEERLRRVLREQAQALDVQPAEWHAHEPKPASSSISPVSPDRS
jgi:DNA-directed RNA polymerase specialized sigma24 family protein